MGTSYPEWLQIEEYSLSGQIPEETFMLCLRITAGLFIIQVPPFIEDR